MTRLVAERVPAFGRVGREAVCATRVLIADLVEILAIEFESEFEAVLAMVPGNIVDELGGVILVFVRAIGIIAKGGETISAEAHVRNAPCDRQAPRQIGKTQRRDDVIGVPRNGGEGIVEPRVTETRFVDDIRCKDARVGTKVLFITGEDLATALYDGLRVLTF